MQAEKNSLEYTIMENVNNLSIILEDNKRLKENNVNNIENINKQIDSIENIFEGFSKEKTLDHLSFNQNIERKPTNAGVSLFKYC